MKLLISSSTTAPPVPVRDDEEVSGLHRLPMFELGTGDRHENCIHYSGCLGRWIKSKPGEGLSRAARSLLLRARPDLDSNELPAQCPVGCDAHTEPPAHVRQALAHTFGHRTGESAL